MKQSLTMLNSKRLFRPARQLSIGGIQMTSFLHRPCEPHRLISIAMKQSLTVLNSKILFRPASDYLVAGFIMTHLDVEKSSRLYIYSCNNLVLSSFKILYF